jgi:hypothetical protein
MGWQLIDSDDDGYMEFYSLIIDGCVENWQHPTTAKLLVLTNETNLLLDGRTYSLLEDSTDAGGDYKGSDKLVARPKLMQKAEDAWEVYIME